MVRLRKLRCHQYNLFRILKPDQLPPNLAYLEIAASGMDFSMFEKLTDLRVRWQNVYYGPTGFPSTLTRLVILGNVLLPDSKISGLDGLRSVEFCNLDDFFTIFESPGCQLKLTDLGIKLPHRHYVEASKKLKFTENLNARILANLRSIESLTWQFAVIPLNFFDSMVCLKRIKILGFGEFVRGSFIEIPSVTEVEFDNVYHWQGIVKYFPNVRSLTLRLCEFENPLKKPLMDLEELEIMNCGVSDLGLKKWNCIMRSVYLRIIDCNIGPDVFEKITGESVTCNFGLCYASFGGVFQKMWGLRKLCLPDFSGFPITTFRQVPYVVGRCI
ncbi:MAG: hypothetical protein Hyperionvirus5_2 [Hyperionvirus sp.]|uniref:Uncharacterized protein n=1 Tax=Hyperionvirus sp. TaxID=2487770 RepID=A0A3G5A7F7_9VIRU|nr:MAG: hypothetical protein Hyperionvirus5_2 [Hyperionvirus sp.]